MIGSVLFRALPGRLAGVLFVWSEDAFGYCVSALEEAIPSGYRRHHTSEAPCRSARGAWALVANPFDVATTKEKTLLSQLVGGNGVPWVVVNMTHHRHEVPLDFFTDVCVTIRDRDAPLISLNAPPHVTEHCSSPVVCWLDADTRLLPAFMEPHEAWWRRLLENTRVDLNVLPIGFDEDVHEHPMIYWPASQEPAFE